MKNSEIRELTVEQINEKIFKNKKELLNLRFRKATGDLENPSTIRELRKEVARMKTILNEHALQEK